MIDTRPRVEFGAVRNRCGCRDCVTNCEHLPGYLIPADLGRLIPPDADPEAWARVHLRASPGAIVVSHGTPLRVPTLVPAPGTDGPACHWLEEGRCAVHADAPFACAFFDCKQSRARADDLSARGLMAIIRDHQAGGLYSRLWMMLWDGGLRTAGPTEKRAAMAAAIRKRRPKIPPRTKRRH
jgi:hypothetical protein